MLKNVHIIIAILFLSLSSYANEIPCFLEMNQLLQDSILTTSESESKNTKIVITLENNDSKGPLAFEVSYIPKENWNGETLYLTMIHTPDQKCYQAD